MQEGFRQARRGRRRAVARQGRQRSLAEACAADYAIFRCYRLLIEYTQAQCRLYGIPMREVPSGRIWSPIEKRWQNGYYVELPVIEGQKIILVPKYCVTFKMALALPVPNSYSHPSLVCFVPKEVTQWKAPLKSYTTAISPHRSAAVPMQSTV